MSQSPLWWRALVLSTIVLCIVFAMRASGQDKKPASGTLATIDIAKVSNEYKTKQAIEADLQNMSLRYRAMLARRNNMPFLTEDEQKSLDTIYEKGAAQTDADKNKIKELETKNLTASNEIQALRQKKDTELTDADKAKLKTADETLQKAQQALATLNDDLENKLRQEGNSRQEELMKQLRSSIAKVAEQKGIAIVFNSEVAPYAGTDITQAVLADLNKGK